MMDHRFATVAFIAFIFTDLFYLATLAGIPLSWELADADSPIIEKMCRDALHLFFRRAHKDLDLGIKWRRDAQIMVEKSEQGGVFTFKADFGAAPCETCVDAIHCNATQAVRAWTNDKDLDVQCHEPLGPGSRLRILDGFDPDKGDPIVTSHSSLDAEDLRALRVLKRGPFSFYVNQ